MISISRKDGKLSYEFQGTNEEEKLETTIALASYMNSIYEETENLPSLIKEIDEILFAATDQFCQMLNISTSELLATLTLVNHPDLIQSDFTGGLTS